MRFQVRIANLGLKLVLNGGFRIGYRAETMRRNFRLMSAVSPERLRRRYPDVRLDTAQIGGIPCETLTPASGSHRSLIYLHGGGYFMGSAAEYRKFAAYLATRLKVKVILPNYRLAPEFPHPAPLEDSLTVYRELLRKTSSNEIVLGGDSAGGGLALSTLLALREQRLPLPQGAFFISPWFDRTGSCPSIDSNAGKDVWLSRRHLEAWAPWSIGSADPRDPLVSPLFGEFSGFPPLLIFVGDQEVLLDEATYVIEKAKSMGVRCELVVGKDMQHDWMLTVPWLEESRSANKKLLSFLRELGSPTLSS